MHLDRGLQLSLLERLAKVYPRYTVEVGQADLNDQVLGNLWYLKEQGLIDGALDLSTTQAYMFEGVRITAKGLDFLADDGGLSAILGTVTVRIHPDSIKGLLINRLDAVAPTEKKSWLKKKLETASDETLKKIVTSVVDEGIKHAPDLYRILERALT